MKSSQELEMLNRQGSLKQVKPRVNIFSIDCVIISVITIAIMTGFITLTILGFDAISNLPKALQNTLETIFNFRGLAIVAILIPFIGAIIQYCFGKNSQNRRDILVVNITFLTLVTVLAMYPGAVAGRMNFQIPNMLGFGLNFNVDMLSLTMAVITSVLWLIVMMYSHDYMLKENHRNRFYLFMSITYGAILGTVMASDLFTMFLFFEIMTLSSYMLVSHCENEESMIAGYNYIYLGLIGGLSILLGIILLYSNTGTLAFLPLASKLQELGTLKYWIIGLLIFGFGIKAGMVPIHIWLPKAHPVAPTPASALLSGIMIKIGAYGILRVSTSFFFPAKSEIEGYKDILWDAAQHLGAVIIWLGIVTMALGVFMALQQLNIKKMLAYHSISQIGYIVMGIGVSVYLGHKGAMGFSGSIYHIINHALFKALLFMVGGVIYLHTHELDMYKLGGLWRKTPFLALVCLIAALGITGMPGFNGFASKSILHHAIVEAYEYGHHSFRYAEIMFTIISAGTACSFIKLFGFVFLGKLPEKYKDLKISYSMMDLAMGGVALLIIAIGVKPNYLLNHFIIPAARTITYDAAFIDKYLINMNFFNAHDMQGMIWVYLMGAGIFVLGIKFHLFHLHFPEWLKIEYLFFYPLNRLFKFIGDTLSESDKKMNSDKDGIIDHFITAIRVLTGKYEMPFIQSDTTIYTMLLTISLVALVLIR